MHGETIKLKKNSKEKNYYWKSNASTDSMYIDFYYLMHSLISFRFTPPR